MTCKNNDHDWHLRIVDGGALLMCIRQGCTGGADDFPITGYDLTGDENYWYHLQGDIPVNVMVNDYGAYTNNPDFDEQDNPGRWIKVSPRTGTTDT